MFKSFKKSFSTVSKVVHPDRFINYFLKPGYYTYNDHTLFIEKVFDNNFTELILCPNNHGKTFNMETLKYFLSCNQLIDERVDKNARLDFFRSTKIFKDETFFQSHFAKYPVILINFKELDQTNYRDNIEKFRFLVSLQFEQVLQFLQQKEFKENLNSIDIKNIEDFFQNYKNFSEHHLINSCKDLGKILLKLTKQNPFMLIDDYDYPLLNSHRKGFYEDMLHFMHNFINISIKNNNFINKTLVTGVNLLEHKELFSQVSNVIVNHYNDSNNKYYPYFKHFYDENTSHQGLADNLNLKSFIEALISDNKGNYISGMKVISDLKMKIDNVLLDKVIPQNENVSDIHTESLELSSTSVNKFSPTFLYSYLYYNGLINRQGFITSKFSANIIKDSLPSLDNPHDLTFDYNRKLAYAYYSYLFNGKMDNFLDYTKGLFDFVAKASRTKNSPAANLLPDFNFSFRTDKELEEYIIDIMTLDMNNENTDRIQIFSVDDDEGTKIQDELKKFTLITYDKKNFAIFLKTNKFKKAKETATAPQVTETPKNVEIDELMNNPNLHLPSTNIGSTVKKSSSLFTKKAPTVDILTELRKLNEDTLATINKQEAINFLMKISPDYETVFFVSLSNYQKQFDYLLEIVKLEKE